MRLLMIAVPVMLSLCGCGELLQPPVNNMSQFVSEEEIKDHIYFLSSDRLNGRKPGTPGWLAAQTYIVRSFDALGLRKWKGAKSYRLPFRNGVNVAGVIPGTDPLLKKGCIVVCAHYDHIGKGSPGAGDNASGVAAMLEIAEMLAASDWQPARSVCFIAFDREESGLAGSLAFWERKDVVKEQIAACINIDTLGRGVLDIDCSLYMLRNCALEPAEAFFCTAASVNSLGLHKASLAPFLLMGDHFIFAINDVPTYFFSNGPYVDMHKPEDRPEYIDHMLVRNDAMVIAEGIKGLAESAELAGKPVASFSSDEDLKLIRHVLGIYLKVKDIFRDKKVLGNKLREELDERVEAAATELTNLLRVPEADRHLDKCARFYGLGVLAYSSISEKDIKLDVSGKLSSQIRDREKIDYMAEVLGKIVLLNRYGDDMQWLRERSKRMGFIEKIFRRSLTLYGINDKDITVTPMSSGRRRIEADIMQMTVRAGLFVADPAIELRTVSLDLTAGYPEEMREKFSALRKRRGNAYWERVCDKLESRVLEGREFTLPKP